MKILLLGATGMLGHVLYRELFNGGHEVYGTILGDQIPNIYPQTLQSNIICNVNAESMDSLLQVTGSLRPDVIINCIGVVNAQQIEKYQLSAITINALLPHRLALLCNNTGARFVHISTDGVFDGSKGMYLEGDDIIVSDKYGMTKCLGEVSYKNCLTLRTSIIGHEIYGKRGLVEWFLAQKDRVKGYSKVIYSGFPTIELSRIIIDYVLEEKQISGIYHVSSDPISKYELLCLIAETYKKKTVIEAYNEFALDRSLDSSCFRELTGYSPPAWSELVKKMYLDYREHEAAYLVSEQNG